VRRSITKIAGVLILLVVAAGVWIGFRARSAEGNLEAVRTDVANVRADLVEGRDATADLHATQRDAKAADGDTHDPIWFGASWLPPVKTVRGLASVADDLANQALPPVVAVGPSVAPSKLQTSPGTIALAPLQAAAPKLAQADAAAAHAKARVAGLPGGWFGAVGSARTNVLDQLTSLSGSLDAATRFARAGPSMLGADGPRTYFVGVQNNAESRGTGGLIAGYAIVTADRGTVRVVQQGSDAGFREPSSPVLDLGGDLDRLYGSVDPTSSWSQSNISPNFPTTADIWAHLWEAQSHQHIDGVIGVDPPALAALLNVTGPVTVAGYSSPLTGANLTGFMESKEYAVFTGANQTLRKTFLTTVATAILHKLLSGGGDSQAIATALGHEAGTSHLSIWSAQPAEQAQISGTPLAGEIPVTKAPFVSMTVDNAGASKLDYYLDRTLTYRAVTCSGPTRPAVVTVTLNNTAPAHGLPAYVTIRGDLASGNEAVSDNHVFVYVHTSDGARLTDATMDGNELGISSGIEQGHPVYYFDVVLAPGQPRTAVLHLTEPIPHGAPTTKVQPLARSQQTHLDVPTC
jgi:Protein of unknown function (DUF4012)